jgi:hypothetical protein
MTSKEKQNENLYEWISGILGQISNGYPLQRSVSYIFAHFLFKNLIKKKKTVENSE